ncbi:hypothetical protein J0J70_08485 [Turicibacter bilis]|uniref:DUF8171 domain-containing protein n=1 Tax=Turicibacter bilis TaxID=2735723 RepID=A0A9Q9FEK4_9FIRM|nr:MULTISPECIES: hypothetical protein [Turicibacter]MBS3199184.1 cell division protein FtsQ [Turicibacter bilis]MBS3201683.1 cell division protein FtsQ [Turicibacter bilis]UUF05678.1 hypothetical protein J0J69_11560 [Turicibacter bilis]UUF07662.1 hypothetical protein J0J70_08485 [Turicibacter bilis]
MSLKKKYELNQSQKLMVFVLSMSLYGLSMLFTELIPKFQIGFVELSVEYFAFIPLTLCILFDPFSAAIGAATGEIIFSEIMLGQFGGFGEVEKFILFSLGMYVAGLMVKDPKNRRQIAVASIIGVAIHQLLACGVDILKVQFAIEEFEAVAGLPESVYFTEGFACLNDILFSGILFCMIPTMYLVPRLYGKIEPLLGIQPRSKEYTVSLTELFNAKMMLTIVGCFVAAVGFEFMADLGINFIDWEAEWAESTPALIMAMALALIVALGVFFKVMKKQEKVSV